MAMVINLREIPHDPAQLLLPWFVNGTLDDVDTRLVESHLMECAQCRAEVETELELAAGVSAFARANHQSAEGPRLARRGQPLSFLSRRVAMGWALAGPVAAAALLLVMFLPERRTAIDDVYQVQGANSASDAGNVIVLFSPDARERVMRDALSEARARVVDGPTANGAYLLHVPPQHRRAALERLRANRDVTLAEPIGGE